MQKFFTLTATTLALNLNALVYKDLNENVTLGFDDRGLLVEERTTGNLTGSSSTPETYSIRYQYSDNGRLISREEDNGIRAELQYDEENSLHTITLYHDDKARRLSFTPSFEKAENVVETILDLSQGIETIVSETNNSFNDRQLLQFQEFFSPHHEGHKLFHYDSNDHPIAEIDETGSGKEWCFDNEGKLLATATLNQNNAKEQTVYSYHENDKPVAIERNGVEILREYDSEGQTTAEIDFLGNRFEYVYDDHGRIIEAVFPWVYDGHEQPYQPTEKWQYDQEGRLTRHKNLAGDWCTITYTARGQPATIIYDDGLIEQYTYHLDGTLDCKPTTQPKIKYPTPTISNDESLQEIKIILDGMGQQVLQHVATDSDCNVTTMTLDALGRIAQITKRDCYGQETLNQINRYDGLGNKVVEKQRFISPDGQDFWLITRWEYGSKGLVKKVVEAEGLPEQRVTHYSYDEYGQLIQTIQPDGVTLYQEYDSDHRLVQLHSSEGSVDYQLIYDEDKLVQVIDNTNQISIERLYDQEGQLISESFGNGLAIQSVYDHLGRRQSFSLPDGSGLVYDWDEAILNAIHRTRIDGSVRYSHHFSSKRKNDQLIGSQGYHSYDIDQNGCCNEIVTPFWSESIPAESYDSKGKIYQTIITEAEQTKTNSYHYDNRERLIRENDKQYSYDTLSNRYEKEETHYNALCQLLQKEDCLFTYDARGNLATKTVADNTTYFSYDALNRLTDVVLSCGKRYHYTYDYFNRRISKSCILHGHTLSEERYFYDGHKEIGAVDSKDRVKELRVLGPGLGAEVGASVAIELKGKTYAPVHDHRGTIVSLIHRGQLAESYAFSAYGEEEQIKQNNPWRFSSKRHDPETGFVYFGKRYYDPSIGRWTTPDPMGAIEGANRYQFVGSNPVTEIDLYGSFSLRAFWCDVYDYWDTFAIKASDFYRATDKFIKENISFEARMQPHIDRAMHAIFGEVMLVLLGYHADGIDVGVYGEGEKDDKVRVTVINGILNIRSWAENNARLLSKTHSNINVHYIFRPTRGWTQDLVKATFVKFGYASQEARLLARTWKQLIQEMGGVDGGGIIVHYAHSIGGADTAIARQFLTPEEQKMIRVISLGSPMIIPHEGFHSVINYMSLRDGIFFLAPLSHFMTLFTHDHNIIYLDSYWGIPVIDHLMNRGSYKTLLETLGREFNEEYLNKKEKE